MTEPERWDARLRGRLETVRARSLKAAPWRDAVPLLAPLVNRSGHVPVRARLTREDLAFLGAARDDLLALTRMALRLADLHRPQDGGGISSDPSRPILRCRSCMARWPCPTLRAVDEALFH
ncbi:hypothetical protein BTM25_05680 [Actinomadura rubteroloni]|uniref:Uncharacterized protein n=1 Tax=Actinomadura rubteroloni TaxID=1926885 RepID=A0A2P4UME9_9ACTN|nr:hypothetical protein [Actinomadura rubteroloni]POM26179.1 hypothetical protein BTM25_05680 [Actinomadura rubteroloni]